MLTQKGESALVLAAFRKSGQGSSHGLLSFRLQALPAGPRIEKIQFRLQPNPFKNRCALLAGPGPTTGSPSPLNGHGWEISPGVWA